MTSMAIDAIELEVVKASLSGIVQEMQNSLFRTGFSTIVRESQDASCALMNARARWWRSMSCCRCISAPSGLLRAVIAAFGDDIAEGDAFLINHPYEGGSPHAPDMRGASRRLLSQARCSASAARSRTRATSAARCPEAAPGQAREIFNEGLHLPAVRYQRGLQRNGDHRAHHRRQQPHARAGARRHPRPARRRPAGRTAARRADRQIRRRQDTASSATACWTSPSASCAAAIAEWTDGRFEAERFVDDDGIELEKPVRIHVVVDKHGDALAFDFSGSADQTKGPANIRPPLVQAACAYALISLIDPHMYVSSGLLRAFAIKAREGSVLNPRFPAPVNTYNPTVHALVDALFAAITPHRAAERARRRQRQPLDHPRRPQHLGGQGLCAI